MRSETVTASLGAQKAVFDYTRVDPTTRRRRGGTCRTSSSSRSWATEGARELKREGSDYKVVNGLGEFFEINADAETGVIDMFAGTTKDQMAIFPTRAVELPDGRTAFSFTMFQGPEMSNELFESEHQSLKREFANIAAVFAN